MARAINPTNKTQKAIRRTWGGLPVVDAKVPLRVFVQPADFQEAVPFDPERCVLSRACQRAYRGKALFTRTTAYVQLPDSKGVPHVERFHLDADSKKLLAAFDRGLTTLPEGGFLLRAPRKSQTLEKKRVRSRATHERVKQGIQLGKTPARKTKPKTRRFDGVRSLTGKIHFKITKGK